MEISIDWTVRTCVQLDDRGILHDYAASLEALLASNVYNRCYLFADALKRHALGKATDERREVMGYGESSAPAEDGDGDADTGDVKR